jgi:hypothetical protein
MQDQNYPGQRTGIQRERDRIVRALRGEAGVTVTGSSVSPGDEIADVCWHSPSGTWLAVISPLPPPGELEPLPDATPPEDGPGGHRHE